MDTPIFDPKLARKVQYARADFYIQIASLTLLYYDYLLTLPLEIKYIWTTPKKLSTFFYFCCRYSLLANLLWTLTKAGKPEVGLGVMKYHEAGLSCDTVSVVSGAFSIFGHVGILAVWGLRTHALCEGNKAISGLLGALGVTIIASLITVAALKSKEGFTGCVDPPAITKLGISTGVLVFLFEILAFAIAAHRAWSAIRQDTKFWDNPKKSLHYVIFSQGLLYLSAVLVITIVTAVCNLQVWGGFARPLNSLKLPLSCLLTARFLLHLRQWQRLSVLSTRARDTNDHSHNNSAGHMTFSPNVSPSKDNDTQGAGMFSFSDYDGYGAATSTGAASSHDTTTVDRSPTVVASAGGRRTGHGVTFEDEKVEDVVVDEEFPRESPADRRRRGDFDSPSSRDEETSTTRGVLRFLRSTGKVMRELAANVGPAREDGEAVQALSQRSRGLRDDYDAFDYGLGVDANVGNERTGGATAAGAVGMVGERAERERTALRLDVEKAERHRSLAPPPARAGKEKRRSKEGDAEAVEMNERRRRDDVPSSPVIYTNGRHGKEGKENMATDSSTGPTPRNEHEDEVLVIHSPT